MKVAVLCPTRGRKKLFGLMLNSIIKTSDSADVLAYVDEDESEDYFYGLDVRKLKMVRGARVGPVSAANSMTSMFPDYEVYGMITDDSIVVTKGWDEWLLQTVAIFPNRVCVVSPHHNVGDHVDMPFVSRAWVKATGWFAAPPCYHYCWPTITGMIGEMSAIAHAPKERFSIMHAYDAGANLSLRGPDAENFYDFMSRDMMPAVERVREAMIPVSA